MTNEMNEKLGVARELLNAEGAEAARAIRRGAEIVRELAEREDVPEAWELILWGHEKGLAPFKTNKFGRVAKNALARLKGSGEFFSEGDRLLEAERNSPLPDFSWVENKKKRDSILSDYRQLRSSMSEIVGSNVYKLIKREDIDAAAARFGIARKGRTLVFDSEEEMAIMTDFCVFMSCANGKIPAIAQYMNKQDVGSISELERRSWECWKRYRYTVVEPVKFYDGFGVLGRDLLSRRELVLVDRGLGSSRDPGIFCLAVGLLPFGDCFMTTGTALPLPTETIEDILAIVLKEQGVSYEGRATLMKKEQIVFAGHVIRMALAGGLCEHIRYQ